MSHLDTVKNAIHTRVVYWGPAGAGKTATLASLRRFVDPEGKAYLYSLARADGATMGFDLLPLDEFTYGAHRVRMRVVAVAGAADRAADRTALVRDGDVVVVVLDSRRGAIDANRASLEELDAAIEAGGVDPATVPVVCAFNHQDDPDALPALEMRAQLVGPEITCFDSVATDGSGVFETFAEAFRLLLARLVIQYEIDGVDPAQALPARYLPQLVRGVMPALSRDKEFEARHFHIELPDDAPTSAQLALVEAHVEVAGSSRLLGLRNREMMAVNRVARSILSAMEADNLLVVLLDSTADHIGASHASCVVFDQTEKRRVRTHVLGFGRDPALGLPPEAARSFLRLLHDSDGPVPLTPEHNPELLAALSKVDGRVRRALYQPIKSGARPAGWIGIYATGEEPPLRTQELLFLSSISRLAGLGLDKIALLEEMQRATTGLERKVHQTTGDLEMANAKIRALNRGLESRVAERTRSLEDSNRALKEARAGAVHSARLRGMGALAASFAHEVNNPVAGLAANLDYMRENLDELRARVGVVSPETADALRALEEFEEVIEESRQSAQRISHIIASLKRFGGEENVEANVSINAAVADAVTLLEERLGNCAELELRLGTLPDVTGDSLELNHVVLAILTNAVEAQEAVGSPGRIEVTTFASGEQVTLMVKDTGVGVPSDVLPRIFEPFVSTKEGEPSAGLGLHCAYRAVKNAGGSIRVRSKAGDGTTVTVLLPAAARAPETTSTPEAVA